MTRLTPAQRVAFDADGYLAPIDAFPADEAAESRRRLEALLAPVGGRPDVRLRNSPHLLLRWVSDLVRDPRVLDAVEDVLGPNLLILRTTLFVKPPRDGGFIAWHQDVAYWDLSGDRVVSAWIALTDSTTANGCMRVVPGSHRGPLLAHGVDGDRNNTLLRGQVADVVIAPERIADIELRAGQLSLHHGRILHGSAGNPSAALRAGLAVRCISPDVRQRGPRPSAMVVRGVDACGHYRHQPVPRFDFDPIARAWHARSLRRYAAQVAWQALRRPSPRQLEALARAVGRGGMLRALWRRRAL
jgi:non-heme Fe2+,alpha-ketoglutarate-dependent halogenase